jgi:hypothetical protein
LQVASPEIDTEGENSVRFYEKGFPTNISEAMTECPLLASASEYAQRLD